MPIGRARRRRATGWSTAGTGFTAPDVVDDASVQAIRDLFPLAPLHNPANVLGHPGRPAELPRTAAGRGLRHRLPPDHAARAPTATPCPRDLPASSASGATASTAPRTSTSRARRPSCSASPADELNLITLHLGNGACAAAVAGGRCVETSMGLTPLEGLVMGTRSGDLDPAVAFHLIARPGCRSTTSTTCSTSAAACWAWPGTTTCARSLAWSAEGDERPPRRCDVYCYRIRKYLGAYAAVLGRLDAIVFTAGVGENDPAVRAGVSPGLEGIGVALDAERNGPLRPRPGRSRPTTPRGRARRAHQRGAGDRRADPGRRPRLAPGVGGRSQTDTRSAASSVGHHHQLGGQRLSSRPARRNPLRN